MQTRRLTSADQDTARHLFGLMAGVFGEAQGTLSEQYVAELLARDDFWVMAAWLGDEVVAGVTAHALPMTTSQSRELFIYDIAVKPAHQRRGVGRLLLTALRAQAAAVGIEVVFVAADDEDQHALDFYRALGGQASPVTMFTFE